MVKFVECDAKCTSCPRHLQSFSVTTSFEGRCRTAGKSSQPSVVDSPWWRGPCQLPKPPPSDRYPGRAALHHPSTKFTLSQEFSVPIGRWTRNLCTNNPVVGCPLWALAPRTREAMMLTLEGLGGENSPPAAGPQNQPTSHRCGAYHFGEPPCFALEMTPERTIATKRWCGRARGFRRT